jgi:hypothetical protein
MADGPETVSGVGMRATRGERRRADAHHGLPATAFGVPQQTLPARGKARGAPGRRWLWASDPCGAGSCYPPLAGHCQVPAR